MALVAIFALGSWAFVAYDRATRVGYRQHTHTFVDEIPTTPRGVTVHETIVVPFWSIYWRTALGLAWDWNYICSPDVSPHGFACSFDHPELLYHPDKDSPRIEYRWDLVRAIRHGSTKRQ